jgi:hypothetical protein
MEKVFALPIFRVSLKVPQKEKDWAIAFLRHIERNSILLFLIPADSKDHKKEFEILHKELEEYNPDMLQKDFVIAVSKSDMLDEELKAAIEKELPKIFRIFLFLLQNKYYCAFAGSADFPFSVFDTAGKILSGENTIARFDIRGNWYNSKTKTLQANGYNNSGWTAFKIDADGLPVSNEVFIAGLHQPNAQSVGAFSDKLQKVYFLNSNSIDQYNLNGDLEKQTPLYLKATPNSVMIEMPWYYNNALIYTGITKGEIGLLNNHAQTIELYNVATGKFAAAWQLPAGIPDNKIFNFAYANGIVWLFDKESRTWYGYQ